MQAQTCVSLHGLPTLLAPLWEWAKDWPLSDSGSMEWGDWGPIHSTRHSWSSLRVGTMKCAYSSGLVLIVRCHSLTKSEFIFFKYILETRQCSPVGKKKPSPTSSTTLSGIFFFFCYNRNIKILFLKNKWRLTCDSRGKVNLFFKCRSHVISHLRKQPQPQTLLMIVPPLCTICCFTKTEPN